jgi:NodT family efflux transporter outer membrane factor (OMF) lipoprotein
MPSKKSLTNVFYMVVAGIVLGGCKIATPPSLPVAQQMPDTYIGHTDTLTDGNIRWQEFFTDSLLTDLIETALNSNFDMLTAIQRVEIARANYAVRQGALLPSLSVVASSNIGNVNQNMVGNADQGERINNIRDEYFLGFQSSWEVDVWGRLKNEKKAAYARFLASEKGRHLVTTALVAEVARLYYELLAVDNELEVVRKNIDFQEIALEIINIQKMGGRATELAVQQFTAQLLSTKALEKEKEQRIIELETEINLLMGRYPQHIPREKDISELVLPPTIHEGVPSTLLLNRPDIQRAELQLLAAEADLQAARAAFLPSVTISPYVGLNALDASLLFQTPESLAAGLLGGVTAPIFNKKRIRSEFNRSVAERLEAYYAYQKTIIQGYGEVVNNIRGIDNLEQIYELKEEEVEVLLEAVSTSNVLFTSGYASYLEVITAQKSVLEAELELANIKKGIFHSVIGLYKALGGGWSSK